MPKVSNFVNKCKKNGQFSDNTPRQTKCQRIVLPSLLESLIQDLSSDMLYNTDVFVKQQKHLSLSQS